MRRSRCASLTLLEVVFSMALFAIVLMGVASAYVVVERSQQMTQERFGALLAAQTMIDEVQNFVDMNQANFPANLDLAAPAGSYQQMGFHVYNASSATGSDKGLLGGAGGTTGAGSGSFLKPATPAGPNGVVGDVDDMFPASRATSAFVDVTKMAGYVEITSPDSVNRPNLRQVTVTVAWKSYGGDTKVVLSTLVGPQVQ